MINRIVKIVLIAAFLGMAIWQFSSGHIGNGISLVLLMGLVVLTIFKDERILWAFFQIRRQKTEKAQKVLAGIKRPDLLIKSQEAYYYYLLAMVESQLNSLTKAEKYFRKALNMGLRMKHDQAMAKLNLAGICMAKRKKREATMLLAEAKKLDKHKMLSDQIKMLQQQLKRI
jgi:tetratricopeptide (TPR) repeat protein